MRKISSIKYPVAAKLERTRVALRQDNSPAYGDALRAIMKLERDNAFLKRELNRARS